VPLALRRPLLGALAFISVSMLASCSPAQTGASSSPTTTPSTQPSTTTTTQSLQSVAWANVTVPPEVCPGLSQPVKLMAMTDSGGAFGAATIPAPAGHQFGTPDDLIQEYETSFGSLGPGENVAALFVWCSKTGGTADGQIENSLVIYSRVSGQLTVLSTLTPPQLSDDGIHAPYFDGSAGGITISNGSITTKELFSGGQDAVCCPSGRATTVWTFNGHSFSPSTTVQTQPEGG
jgi:hypothetical protein